MHKTIILSLGLLGLLAYTCAGAAIDLQKYKIEGVNGAGIVGGPGGSTSTNVDVVKQLSQTSDNYGLTRMVQAQVGALGQVAAVGGMDGLFAVEQAGTATGLQGQAHMGGPNNLGWQDQLANVGLAEQVTKLGGIGVALGMQTFVGVQVQIIATPHGVNINAQPVNVAIFDAAGQ
ncbi:MAG: hypothetical protein QHH07_05315 [Sedimentisphaerales bacterium]|nr:hypothetical protein [Sedimentisphaerales bacterium]